MQANTIASNNIQLVEYNAILQQELRDVQQQKNDVTRELLTYQTVVQNTFVAKIHEKRDEIIQHRNHMSAILNVEALKPLDDVISILNDVTGDVLTFKSLDTSRISADSVVCDAPIQRPSFLRVPRLSASRKSSTVPANVKENIRISGKVRPRKIIPAVADPMPPLLEVSNISRVTDTGLNVSRLSVELLNSPVSMDFCPKQASTERKKSKKSSRVPPSDRMSIFNFEPATPTGSHDDSEMDTTISAHHVDMDATLSAPQDLSLLQASFMNHPSFREKFSVGVTGRSTEVPEEESTIDQSATEGRNSHRTHRSTCYGELTDSSHSTTNGSFAGTSRVDSPAPGPSVDDISEVATPEKASTSKRKTAAKGGPKAKKKDAASKTRGVRSQSSVQSLSSTKSDNSTALNSTAADDRTVDSFVDARPRRARKDVSYKEPTLAGKLRRDF